MWPHRIQNHNACSNILATSLKSYLLNIRCTYRSGCICNNSLNQNKASDLMQPSLCISLKFTFSFSRTCACFLPPFHCSPRDSHHIAGSCACRCGREAKDGDTFPCCQEAPPHPVLCLPSHTLPATSCVCHTARNGKKRLPHAVLMWQIKKTTTYI